MAIRAPSNVEHAAIELDVGAALGEPPPVGGNERSAGTRATRRGDPAAAFPYAQPDAAAITDFGDADICAFRKDRIMFECRPERRQIDPVEVIHKKGRVRVADAGADRLAQRTQCQVDPTG